MKKTLLLLFSIFLILPVYAIDFQYPYEGQTLTYTIISETDGTCKTKAGTRFGKPGNSVSGDLKIPDVVYYNETEYSVIEIGEFGFKNCTGLTSVDIGNSVTEISESAFSGCSGLASVMIGNSVTTIGSYAFSGCSGLASIEIPNNVTTIKSYAFEGCSNIKEMIIADGELSINISDYALSKVYLTKLYLGRNYISSAYGTAFNTGSLTELIIGNSVTEINTSTFSGCTGLTSVEIPNSVKTIAQEAFRRCTGLQSIQIGSSVTEIGFYAFNGCTGLTSIEIPNSVTSIGSDAFGNCSNLKEMIIADGDLSLNNVGSNVFLGTYFTKLYLGRNTTLSFSNKLQELIIGNSVTEINEGQFSNCESLTSVEIPNSVKKIGYGAFSDCTGLDSIEIPNSVETIGRHAFSLCTGLKSAYIGGSEIGEQAFCYCSELSSIVMGNSVSSIGEKAFSDCCELSSIEIPSSVTFIAQNAFLNCSNLKEITFADGESTLEFGSSPFGGADLTKLYLGRNIRAVYEPFSRITSLTDLIISNSVTEIGENTFRWCTGLKSVSIGSSLAKIGEFAFSDCKNIEKISSTALVAPDFSISTFSGAVRAYCNVEIPEDAYLSFQHKWACFSCFSDITEENDIISVSSPGNLINQLDISKINDITKLKLIGSINGSDMLILNKCINLASLDLSEATIESGGMPYYEADNKQFASEDNVLGEMWCYNLNSLSFVNLPKNLIKLGNRAFYDKGNLMRVDIPDSLTEIGEEAFRYCFNLRWISIPNGVTEIGWGAFISCSSLSSVEIPNSVTEIKGAVFYNCRSLTSVNIPNTVTSIGNLAFLDCTSLTSIIIPGSVTSIASEAFDGCNSLTKVVSLSQTPPSISPDTFTETTYSTGTLYVDDNCRNVYWLHPSWGKFVNIEGLGSQVILIELNPDKWNGKEGDTFQITATVYPMNASNTTLEWSTSDDSIATVDAEGVVKVLKSGNCVITAKATDGRGVEATCIISATADFDEIFDDGLETISVYNINGVLMLTTDDYNDLRNLDKGIYIIRSSHGKIRKIQL